VGAGGQGVGREAQLTVPGISIHVVDVTRGVPAAGMRVDVYERMRDARRHVGHAVIAEDGVLRHPMNHGTGINAGTYDVEFAIGAWYRAQHVDVGNPAFLEVGTFRFAIVDPEEHVHLPIKLSPYGMSIWRGR
jgi:5-hydroxyisourate hydrolase